MTMPENKPEGTCAGCIYYLPYAGICGNVLSDHRGQYTPKNSVCDEYTEPEEKSEINL